MSHQFVPIDEVITLPTGFDDAVAELKERIEQRDIPKWLLIPGRASGEHATDGAWGGIVMAECYGAQRDDTETATVDARIAWDAEERDRGMSTVTDVPSALQESIIKATQERDNVSMCVARIVFDAEEMTVSSVTVGLRITDESEETD